MQENLKSGSLSMFNEAKKNYLILQVISPESPLYPCLESLGGIFGNILQKLRIMKSDDLF